MREHPTRWATAEGSKRSACSLRTSRNRAVLYRPCRYRRPLRGYKRTTLLTIMHNVEHVTRIAHEAIKDDDKLIALP